MKLSLILSTLLFASVRGQKSDCSTHYLKYYKGNYTTPNTLPWEFSPVQVGNSSYVKDVGGSVNFHLKTATNDTWHGSDASISRVFIEYTDAQTGLQTCVTERNYGLFEVAKEPKVQINFEAGCMKNVPISVITITVLDESFDDSDDPKPPSCCRSSDPDDRSKDYSVDDPTDKPVNEYHTLEYIVVLQCDVNHCKG